MAAYTTSLRLVQPATGEYSGTWGTQVNNGITALVDTSVAGTATITMTAADYTLSTANGATDEARAAILSLGGTPGGSYNVIVPAVSKLYVVVNATGSAQTVKTAAGTGVSVPNGATAYLRCDGTNVVAGLNYFGSLTAGSLTLGTALSVANGGTGATTLTGVVKGSGTSALTAGTVSLTTEVSGTLPVGNGGTGGTTFTANNVLLGNGTSAFQVVAPGASGNVLTSNGTTWQSSAAATLPSQTGNAGKALFTDGTNAAWEPTVRIQSIPILSSAAVSVNPVSSTETITPTSVIFSTGLGLSTRQIIFANSLYVANATSASGSVATSSNGETWTLRTMPSSSTWMLGQDGNNLMAVVSNGTAVATSTDSTTWSSATALPTSNGPFCVPAAISGTWVVVATTGTTAYVSTNFGVSWSTQTTPANPASGGGVFVVGSNFWYIATGGTTAYYSATGLTGSWSSIALPVTVNNIWRQNSTVYFIATGLSAQVYRVDGVTTFTAISNITTRANGLLVIPVFGVYASFSTAFGDSATWHNGSPIVRFSTQSVNTNTQSYESGSISLLPLPSNTTSVLKYTGSNGATGIFTY